MLTLLVKHYFLALNELFIIVSSVNLTFQAALSVINNETSLSFGRNIEFLFRYRRTFKLSNLQRKVDTFDASIAEK